MIRVATAANRAAGVSFFATIVLSCALCSLTHARDDVADRLFGRAGEAQNGGDFEFAAELWDKFLADHKEDPQAIKARHYLGVCRMTLKQYDKAISAFSGVIGDKKADTLPQLEESFYYLGWCQFSAGQQGNGNSKALNNAIKTFDQHIKKFEKGKFLDQAYFLKGEALYFLGQKQNSITAYAKVVSDFKKSSSRPNALYAMGVSQFEIKKYSDAESTFDLFLKEFGDDDLGPEIRLFRAESILQRGLSVAKTETETRNELLKQASTELAKLGAMETFPKRDEAIYNQALCESQLGNQAGAAKLYVSVAEQFGKSSFANAARLSAGKLFLRTNQLEDAEKWLKEAAASDPSQADESMHWYCQSLLRQKKYAEAQKAAKEAISTAKNQDYLVRLKMDLGDAQYAQPGEKANSIDTYVEIAESHPTHASAAQSLYNAAFAALELKNYQRGLKLSDQFLTSFADDAFVPDVKYVRGECLLLEKQFAGAEKVFADLVEKHSKREELPVWQVRYGLCLYLQDKYQETIDFLETALDGLKTDGQRAESNFLVGASSFYLKKFKQAVTYLDRATAFKNQLKQLAEALVLLAQAHAQEKSFAKARSALDQVIQNHSDSPYFAQANYLCGQYFSIDKKYDEAIARFDVVLAGEQNKYTPFAHYGRGWALLNTQKNQEAKTSFDKTIELGEKDLLADAHYSRAIANRRLKQYKQAVSDVDKCLELSPDFKNRVSALYEKGMALSADQQYPQAVGVFEKLAADFESHADADEFLYQLAWAYKLDKKDQKSVESFSRLTENFGDSVYAAESHYHVGESFYAVNDFENAINQYELANKKAKAKEVAEKSLYKIAWSNYQQKDYDAARTGFEKQVENYGQGDLVDSGRFMMAECYYQQDKFGEAAAAFEKAVPVVVKSKKTNITEKSLACLHAAESANKTGNYDQALQYIATLQDELMDKDYVAEAFLEIGNARRGLKEPTQAISAFTQAFDKANNETGARAGFLVGEVLFGQKKFDEAIRQYKLVIYGYGGTRAPASIKKWQASSGYETARCYHVQIKSAAAAQKQKLIDEARKFYSYVIKNHPKDRLASESKKQLAVLDKLK